MTGTVFSYDALEAQACLMVGQATAAIHGLMKRSASDIVQIGGLLAEIKKILPHGEWEAWLDCEFGWTDRTARRFVSVADRFKTDNLSDLKIAPSALYLLASPSVPGEVVEEAIKRAEAGERITHKDAKEMVDAAKADPEPEAVPEPPADQPSFGELFGNLHAEPPATDEPEDAGGVPEPEEVPERVTATIDDDPPSTLTGDADLTALIYAYLTALPQEFKRRWVTGKEKGYPFNQLSLDELKFVRGGVSVARNFLNDADAKIQDQILFLEG